MRTFTDNGGKLGPDSSMLSMIFSARMYRINYFLPPADLVVADHTSVFTRIVALETALQMPVTLKYGLIQIQYRAQRWRMQPPQPELPEHLGPTFDLAAHWGRRSSALASSPRASALPLRSTAPLRLRATAPGARSGTRRSAPSQRKPTLCRVPESGWVKCARRATPAPTPGALRAAPGISSPPPAPQPLTGLSV